MDKKDMFRLKLGGLTYAEVAKLAGVSRQRVQQILSPPASIRKFVVNKFNGRCGRCNVKVNNHGDVHHKDNAVDSYEDISNLELLCRSCHTIVHKSGKHKITPEMAKRNNIILAYHHDGYSTREIARIVNISHMQVWNVIQFMEGKAPNLN